VHHYIYQQQHMAGSAVQYHGIFKIGIKIMTNCCHKMNKVDKFYVWFTSQKQIRKNFRPVM